jgi:hypothetical protein
MHHPIKVLRKLILIVLTLTLAGCSMSTPGQTDSSDLSVINSETVNKGYWKTDEIMPYYYYLNNNNNDLYFSDTEDAYYTKSGDYVTGVIAVKNLDTNNVLTIGFDLNGNQNPDAWKEYFCSGIDPNDTAYSYYPFTYYPPAGTFNYSFTIQKFILKNKDRIFLKEVNFGSLFMVHRSCPILYKSWIFSLWLESNSNPSFPQSSPRLYTFVRPDVSIKEEPYLFNRYGYGVNSVIRLTQTMNNHFYYRDFSWSDYYAKRNTLYTRSNLYGYVVRDKNFGKYY